ncbi:hypothetical protein Sru01_57020 [Sphaerisporangium rufum]|uniref:Uncharacterized protein n=1 Tax=Sphaerisporangium rufum TaxID=1381558 RepID=A0A919RB53_9ACTN|nr:hypothetical protein [Sphaerisporangium rufum]GII80720.1 hypothetical protein Sru01_57020 [Sphaerisporangium rufum]
MSDCLSPHVKRPQPGQQRVDWFEVTDAAHVRVWAWTCPCRAVYFELCKAGGSAFIRRIV